MLCLSSVRWFPKVLLHHMDNKNPSSNFFTIGLEHWNFMNVMIPPATADAAPIIYKMYLDIFFFKAYFNFIQRVQLKMRSYVFYNMNASFYRYNLLAWHAYIVLKVYRRWRPDWNAIEYKSQFKFVQIIWLWNVADI